MLTYTFSRATDNLFLSMRDSVSGSISKVVDTWILRQLLLVSNGRRRRSDVKERFASNREYNLRTS
ncbi:uncharacterized protein V1477_018710 [Vespula maculifrons]|uniref:Uncharacterized protein n=1 Tax=Vespula maculifrons TaxID=7453 RepID=A0ABD2AW53_VESMC